MVTYHFNLQFQKIAHAQIQTFSYHFWVVKWFPFFFNWQHHQLPFLYSHIFCFLGCFGSVFIDLLHDLSCFAILNKH